MSGFLLTSIGINKNIGLVLCLFKYLITSADFRRMLAVLILLAKSSKAWLIRIEGLY